MMRPHLYFLTDRVFPFYHEQLDCGVEDFFEESRHDVCGERIYGDEEESSICFENKSGVYISDLCYDLFLYGRDGLFCLLVR